MQQYAIALLGAALLLAMSLSLAWQMADWLRLLRAPASIDQVDSPQSLPRTSGQHLATLFGSDSHAEQRLAPADDLGLLLLGSFVHADPAQSSAIIRSQEHKAQRYSVGSSLAGAIRLEAVYADHVELRRNGQRLSLGFAHNASQAQATSYTDATLTPDALNTQGEAHADNLAQLRERMAALRDQMASVGALPTDAEPTEPLTESN